MTPGRASTPACGYADAAFPQPIYNAPNLAAIGYRIGDYLAFRDRLLRALPGETELTAWSPGADGDLALQMMEWWAYVADILTFYNERIANEDYVRTAQLPESVNHLVQLLGYRPRPALGATATLAALLSPGTRPTVQVPARLQVQSKPGPGQAPQVFEVDQATPIGSPDLVIADVAPANRPLLGADGATLWLAGKVTGIKPAERMLLINAQALSAQSIADYAWIKTTGVAPASDPLGNAVTQVTFSKISSTIAEAGSAENYVLLRSSQSSPLWTLPNQGRAITLTTIDLAGVARGVAAGSLLLIDVADNTPPILLNVPPGGLLAGAAGSGEVVLQAKSNIDQAFVGEAEVGAKAAVLGGAVTPISTATFAPTPIILQSCSDVVWYVDGNGSSPPSSPPANSVPVAIPHSQIFFAALPSGVWLPDPARVTIRWSWAPVGQLVPVLSPADYRYPGGGTSLVVDPASKAGFPANAASVLLEDQSGDATQATLMPSPGPPAGATLAALNPGAASGLASPIDVLFNLLKVSRGKTVPSEVLGSGNPMVAGQDFVLSNSPVTYFADPASVSGDGFSSTVQVSVNGVRWAEVRSFYGQSPSAQVYVLREDDQARTHVTFGDGVHGARLPTGVGNVVAAYRYGAGGTAPAAETLTTVLTPTPGLKGVRNPLPPTGGADPDSPERLRSLAPRSVLTFNRAVSIDDFATIAATAGGVTQAVASFAFDPQSQRPLVTIWVAGDEGAVAAAAATLAGAGAVMRSVKILRATAVVATLSLNYLRDPRYDDAAVRTALLSALLDPDTGLLGTGRLGIGQVVYDSQISAACLSVPGVTTIENMSFGPRHAFQFIDELTFVGRRLSIFRPAAPAGCTGHRHDPGTGRYFSIPNDDQHVHLNGAVAP